MTNKNDFEFKYFAPSNDERKEIESIRSKYIKPTKTASDLAKLKKLDAKVRNIPLVVSMCLGVLGLLIFGTGLAMILQWNLLAWGIVVMVLGVPFMICANPVYNILTKKLKEKYSAEILELSERLLSDEEK